MKKYDNYVAFINFPNGISFLKDDNTFSENIKEAKIWNNEKDAKCTISKLAGKYNYGVFPTIIIIEEY